MVFEGTTNVCGFTDLVWENVHTLSCLTYGTDFHIDSILLTLYVFPHSSVSLVEVMYGLSDSEKVELINHLHVISHSCYSFCEHLCK